MKTNWGDEIPAVDKAIEEAAEVLHLLCKIKRFGLYTTHPDWDLDNNTRLHYEMSDLEEAISSIRKEMI